MHLAAIMRDEGQPGATRIAAINTILSYGWTKPKPEKDDDNANGGIRITIRHLFEGRDGVTIEGEAHEVLTIKGNGHGNGSGE